MANPRLPSISEAQVCGPSMKPHLLLDVLDEEGGSSQVVNGKAEEALDLFLVKVHRDDVSQTWVQPHTSIKSTIDLS